MEGNLKENGWFLSSEGIAECKKACTKENPTTSECLKAAANLDLKLYGTKFLPEDLNKGKIDFIKGPGVLQIQKLRNISSPKLNEESNHAPRLLKFNLTDGSLNCQGLEYSTLSDISLSTPPGTKICLRGTVPVKNGVLLLDNENTKVLGGEVESLVTKWKLNKSLAKHSRNTASGEDGPPPFVPFNQTKSQEYRGNSKGNTVSNGHGMENESNRKQPDRYKQTQHETYSNTRRGKDRDQEKYSDRQTDIGSRRDDRGEQRGRRGDSRGGDSRGESFRGDRRYNQDKSYGKFSSDNRSSQKDNRGERDYKGGNRNYENSQSGDSRSRDRNLPRRTDHNRTDKAEKPSQSGQIVDNSSNQRTSNMAPGNARENGMSDAQSYGDGGSDRQGDGRRTLDGQGSRLGHEGVGRGGQGGRGSSRGGRGGRKDGFGRGRSNSMEQDDSEDYRTRQPSDTGTIWDFVKLTIKTPPKSSTSPPAPKESTDSEKNTEEPKLPSVSDTPQDAKQTTQENIPEDTEPQQTTNPRQQQTDRSENTKRSKPDVKPPTSQSGKDQKQPIKSNDRSKDGDKSGRNAEQWPTSFRDNRQRQYQQRQQQSSGQGRGRGPRGRHEDGRSYNQSLPPRLQKKQQQQYHQQYHHDRKSSMERDSHREKTSSPGSGSSGDGRSSQSPSVDSGHSSHSKSSEDMQQRHQQQQQPRRQKGSQKQRQSEEYKTSIEQKQSTGPMQGQYETQMAPSGYISNQPSVQHPHYHVDQQPMYEQQDFNYQQTPPPPPPPAPPQQYPVYQMPAQMGPPQAVMVTQPITSPSQPHLQTPIPSSQMRWKKGEQCLALRRDGQYYSAKIEHLHPDGQQCMVSFQDFHGGCEMISTTSLRPFPIIAWEFWHLNIKRKFKRIVVLETDSNAQSVPVATTITAVPVYPQQAQVAMVPRPQVMLPMQAQPPYPMGPKGPIPSQGPVAPQGLPQPPPGMQWQPAQVNYQELRQPYPQVIHYDPIAQANNPASRPTYYPVPPAGAVQFVRGVKELHGQELYPHTGNIVESTADANKVQPITTVYYNTKPKRTNTRPTQSFYMPPRQQTYGDPAN